jgi:hypothetical protein
VLAFAKEAECFCLCCSSSGMLQCTCSIGPFAADLQQGGIVNSVSKHRDAARCAVVLVLGPHTCLLGFLAPGSLCALTAPVLTDPPLCCAVPCCAAVCVYPHSCCSRAANGRAGSYQSSSNHLAPSSDSTRSSACACAAALRGKEGCWASDT